MPSAKLLTKIIELLMKIFSFVDKTIKKNEVEEEANRRQKVADAIKDDPVKRFRKEFGSDD